MTSTPFGFNGKQWVVGTNRGVDDVAVHNDHAYGDGDDDDDMIMVTVGMMMII